MLNRHQMFLNLNVILVSLFINLGCGNSFKSQNGTSPVSTSQSTSPWSQGISGPLSSTEPYGSQP